MRKIIILALFSLGCAHAPSKVVTVFRLPEAPQAMRSIVKVMCDGSWKGWATPYGSNVAISVAHVIDGCTTIGWQSPTSKGDFIVLKREYSEDKDGTPLKDYALLLSSAQFDSWAEVSKRAPDPGEILWHRLLLFGNVPVNAASFYLGTDEQGFYKSEGTARPGSSGSGWFTSDGQIVGVVNGDEGRKYGRALVWGTPMKEIFR